MKPHRLPARDEQRRGGPGRQVLVRADHRRGPRRAAGSATLALRTQQIVAAETGVAEVVDPLGGSYELEARTDRLAGAIRDTLADVERRGGAIACIESGHFLRELADSAYRRTQAVERGERAVVGVNRHPSPSAPLEVFTVDPALEAEQAAAVRAVRARRDPAAVRRALAALAEAADGGDNVVPACVAAVRAYATVGEIVGTLRAVFGPWRPSAEF